MPAYHARVAYEASEAASGRLVISTFHVEVDTLTSPPDWSSIANDMGVWLNLKYLAMLEPDYRVDQIVVTDENYPGSTHGQGVAVVGQAGTRTAGDHKLDPALCACGSLKTAVAKRYARGHIFMPPARDSTSLSIGGIFDPTSAYWVACLAFFNSLKAGFVAGSTSYVPEIFSRHQEALGLTPFTFHITGGSLGSKSHWLRSRSSIP